MCAPIVLGAVAAGTAIIGGAFSAYNAIQQGNFQSKIAKMNADIAEKEAATIQQVGEGKAGEATMKGSATIGTQVAGLAASGVDVASGSPLNVLTDTRLMSAYDAAKIRSNTEREAYSRRLAGAGYASQASEYSSSGFNAALTTLIGSAGSAAASFQRGVNLSKTG